MPGELGGTDLGATEEGLVLAAEKLDSTKPTPPKNTSKTCKSCGQTVQDIYCGHCGQKNDDLRRSLWRLITESLGGMFSFEGRMWRTWGALLFKPGKVAHEYANGARSRYSSPIRVYLVVSFIFFGFLAITNTNLFAVSVKPKPVVEQSISPTQSDTDHIENGNLILNDEKIFEFNDDYSFDFLFFQSQAKFEELFDKTATDEFLKSLRNSDALSINRATNSPTSSEGNSINSDNSDKSIAPQAKNNDKQAIQIFFENPKKFNAAFNTWLPRVMFFMVPFAMLLGAVFIRGRNALLYDHLIHAMYIHAVFFMALFASLLLAKIIPGSIVAKVLVIIFAIYLPISLRRMFKRGWFKTVLTTVVVSGLYAVILTVAIISISVMSMVNLSA